MPIVVARRHHMHLVYPDRRPQRQIVEVHVYRKIRIVTGRSQVAVIVRRSTHIGGCVRRQARAVGGGRRRIRGGVVRGEVLGAVGAGAHCARARSTGRALRAPQALRQPGVAADELAVLLSHLQFKRNDPQTNFNGAQRTKGGANANKRY